MNKKEKAAAAWHALTAILALKKEVGLQDVDNHLKATSKPHVMAAQFILIGSGCATAKLIPDGDYGDESHASLKYLHIMKTPTEDISAIQELCGFEPHHLLLPIEELGIPMSELNPALADTPEGNMMCSLSKHNLNPLQRNGITHVYQLVTKTDVELLRIERFSSGGLRRIKKALEPLGCTLDMKLDPRVRAWIIQTLTNQ
jgi:hypothetical protein